MSELGITGKRIRKKPKYLRDDEEESEEPEQKPAKQKKQKKDREKRKVKSKKESKRFKLDEAPKPGIKLKIKIGGKSPSSSHASTPKEMEGSTRDSSCVASEGSDDVDIEGETMTITTDEQIPVSDYADYTTTAAYESDELEEEYEHYDLEMDTEREEARVNQAGGGGKGGAALEKDDTSDEEREWLEAVEAGDMEEYEKKKAEKKSTILTARQKRLLHGEEESTLLALPGGSRGKSLTAEQVDMRKEKAIKRKKLALEKSEKAKQQTVDRLLKKSDAAIAKGKTGAKNSLILRPSVRYLISKTQISLSLPPGFEFPLEPQKVSPPPKPVRCGVSGCRNIKKYTCSKTNVPLCSLECYKKNISKLTNGASADAVT